MGALLLELEIFSQSDCGHAPILLLKIFCQSDCGAAPLLELKKYVQFDGGPTLSRVQIAHCGMFRFLIDGPTMGPTKLSEYWDFF